MRRSKRLFWSSVLAVWPVGPKKIADILRKHNLYGSIGENCYIQKRKVPLYSELIRLHDNVCVASNVGFVTHDIIHHMLNGKYKEDGLEFVERVGCIEVMNNVFIGAGTRILYNTRIGNNVIIGSASLVNKDIPDNSVYAGVPARYICSYDDYVKKAKSYSEQFRTEYGLDRVHGVDDALARKLFDNFLKSKEANHEKDNH